MCILNFPQNILFPLFPPLPLLKPLHQIPHWIPHWIPQELVQYHGVNPATGFYNSKKINNTPSPPSKEQPHNHTDQAN